MYINSVVYQGSIMKISFPVLILGSFSNANIIPIISGTNTPLNALPRVRSFLMLKSIFSNLIAIYFVG